MYGQEVNDFVFLKKDAIWTVATSALQEVDRQLQAEKARNQQHDAQISDLESQLQEQASENRALRTALESLESRLESLESVVD